MNLNVGLQHHLLQHHFLAHDAAAPSAHGRDFLADDPANPGGLKSKEQTRCPPVLARRNTSAPPPAHRPRRFVSTPPAGANLLPARTCLKAIYQQAGRVSETWRRRNTEVRQQPLIKAGGLSWQGRASHFLPAPGRIMLHRAAPSSG